MPKLFDSCVKRGGYIKTIQKGKGKYQRICLIDEKEYKGEIKTRKDFKKNKNGNKARKRN